ncbi:MAG TPA: hypothetical protein VGD69_00770 [Herpetosiphonaceae bacterium]
MASNSNYRVHAQALQADRESYIAMQSMPDYTPANVSYSSAELIDSYQAMEAALAAEINAQNALKAARDAARKAEWNFHNAILGAKDQVMAQYGPDSNQVQALGLKKKSDRKRRPRRVPAPPAEYQR